ncbi:MAG: hypothetical protein J2P26_08465 [Nocardiopsaceae bacterium]|nr:hypothetical protein [Nocardiopsaceae bacterium]
MRRHLTGSGLAVAMVLAMFFAGTWGYIRLLRLPAAANAPLSALPAGGGSLLTNTGVLSALAALGGTAVLAGILLAVPRVSALAPGLSGLFALAWQALYLLNVHRALQVIPLRGHAFGAGWEAMLFNGLLGAFGLVMVIPIFVPSRWRTNRRDIDDEASGFMAELKEADPPPQTPLTPLPSRAGGAPTSANPVPAGLTQPRLPRTSLVAGGPVPGAPPPGGPPPGSGPGLGGPPQTDPRLRSRPYRRPDGR